MKKRLISISAVLLLMLAVFPAAHGDMTYAAPEDVAAGSELDYLVATVSEESNVSADEDTLPVGVNLETDAGEAERQNVYLRGVPQLVGQYNCVINVASGGSSNYIVCPLSVVPATVSVTASAQVRCYVGDEAQVSVEAFVNDGGVLSYQWYSNTVLNSTNGREIDGATEPVLKVGTSQTGTTYYYCVVTNTNGGETVSVTSDIIPVTVEDAAIASITVETLPRKTLYSPGEELDTAGLTIRARYTNNSSVVITEGFTVSPLDLGPAGVTNIEVRYEGLTCTFQVTVEEPEEVIEGIGVLTMPTRRDYSVGDRLETDGLSIRVYTSLGYRDAMDNELECSPMVFEKAGTQTVTVSYGGKTCTFTLEIGEGEKPERIFPQSLPGKLQYTIGDTLDTSGLVLTMVTNKGNEEKISSGFTCSPTLLNTVGTMQITVSYEDLTCTFNVNVEAPVFSTPTPTVEPSAAQTPAVQTPAVQTPAVQTPAVPSATPYVWTPAPSPTPHIIEHQSHETKTGSGLLIVLIIAALLALTALGAYVYIMNRGGVEQISAEIEEFIERVKDRFKKQ